MKLKTMRRLQIHVWISQPTPNQLIIDLKKSGKENAAIKIVNGLLKLE
jgi:hypothetical protein